VLTQGHIQSTKKEFMMKKLILASIMVLSGGCATTTTTKNVDFYAGCATSAKIAAEIARQKALGTSISTVINYMQTTKIAAKDPGILAGGIRMAQQIYSSDLFKTVNDTGRAHDMAYSYCMSWASEKAAKEKEADDNATRDFMNGFVDGITASLVNGSRTSCHTTYGRDVFSNVTANTNCW
jgi:hypothetical protein